MELDIKFTCGKDKINKPTKNNDIKTEEEEKKH